MTTAPNLTLYQLETQLLELLNYREFIEENPNQELSPQEQKESLAAIDSSIQVYVMAEVKKCDGIARYLREFETRAAALKEEAKRCQDMAKAWEKRHDNLESMVIGIMQQAGKTRIDGKLNVLSLRKNPPSVEVQSPDLVPGEYKRVAVTMNVALYNKIMVQLSSTAESAPLAFSFQHEAKHTEPEVEKRKIGEELKLGGSVPGCRLKTDSVRLEVR